MTYFQIRSFVHIEKSEKKYTLSTSHFPKYGKPLKIITDHRTQFTSPKNWLNFPPSNSEFNYERKLEMAKNYISRKGKNRAAKFNEAYPSIASKDI